MKRKFSVLIGEGSEIVVTSTFTPEEVSSLTHLAGVTAVVGVATVGGYEPQTTVTLKATVEGVQEVFSALAEMTQSRRKITITAEEVEAAKAPELSA